MMTRTEHKQIKFHMITIEDLVPDNHFLRKVNHLVDFSFIYQETAPYYCNNNGRPCIDPVILIKYLLIGFLFGIESERRIEQEIQVNMAYRWFLGLDLDEPVPDHSTISQNRRRRFHNTGLFRRLFEQILLQCMEKGLVEGHTILTDSTHVKANASSKKDVKIMVEKESNKYMERLDFYEAQERSRLESCGAIKPQRKSTVPKKRAMVEKTINTTDPEAGILHWPRKPEGMHYLSHQSIDTAHGIVVDVAVTAGKELPLRSLEREQFNVCRVYRADRKDCRDCPMLSRCVSSSQRSRTVRVNIFEEAVKRHRERDGTPAHYHILNLRQIWCEGSFAAQKARHNLGFLYRWGLEAAEAHCLLSAMALNLKRMVKCLG